MSDGLTPHFIALQGSQDQPSAQDKTCQNALEKREILNTLAPYHSDKLLAPGSADYHLCENLPWKGQLLVAQSS